VDGREELDIHRVREEFPVTRKWVYMNHAGVSPISRRVYRAMGGILRDVGNNGMAGMKAWQRATDRTRKLAARLIGSRPSEIAFVKNTSEGISTVANGLAWRPGDNVVTADREFPANVYPWLNLNTKGVETRRVSEVDGRIPLEDLLGAADERTRLVSISSVEFASGFRHDLKAIGDFCKPRGILFLVDAIQSLGAFRLDVADAGIDFISADAHKWLLGPEGTGIFYCSRRGLKNLQVVNLGWANVVNPTDFLSYDLTLLPDARRFENGTLNTVGVYALKACFELIQQAGIERIENRVLSLTDRLSAGLEEKGYELVSSRREGEKSGIVAFRHPAHSPESLYRRLFDASIVGAVRGGCCRLSPHFYNTEDEIDRILNVLP
jgi:selenocysteine lyase/cysteine desulfurase